MARDQVTLQHRVEFLGWKLVTGILKLIPRRGAILFADAAGWIMYYVLRVRRDVIDQQLSLAFGSSYSQSELNEIGCRSWQNCVLTFFEFLQPPPAGGAPWEVFKEQEGYEQNCAPLTTTKIPSIIVTGHIGNWEACGRLALRENITLTAVAKPMHNPLVNASIIETRTGQGLEVLQIKLSMKSVVDAVRDGKWVAFVGDQDARRRGVFVDFFGRPASTAPGAAHFAYKLNVPIVPAFCVRLRDPERHLKIIFMPTIWPDQAADRDEELTRITQAHTSALEEVIRRYPGDYFWLHRRWKTRPKRAAVRLQQINGNRSNLKTEK